MSEEATSPRVHDFRAGTGHWGHALHTSTWRQTPDRIKTRGWGPFKKEIGRFARASVMVHCTPWPEVGDRLLMTGKLGERSLKIVEVDPCWEPRDMFTLTLEFDQ